MQIQLEQVVPHPLKEKIQSSTSEVWNKTIQFQSPDYIKIKAPSGSGKTTFIHSIYGLRADFSGTILLNNKPIQHYSKEQIAIIRQQQISIVFQDLRLFPQLTAKENIELNRVLSKPIYNSSQIEIFAEKLNIQSILHQPAGLCSYGEQQRVAIIRALIQPFEFLIMDEPFSHLDQQNIQLAINLIKEECEKRNAGILLTDLENDHHFPYTQQLEL